MSDACPQLREVGDLRVRRRLDVRIVWDKLEHMLPGRSRSSLKHHASRELMKGAHKHIQINIVDIHYIYINTVFVCIYV